MQYYYQSGCLYRLRALGERHNMDITVGTLLVKKWHLHAFPPHQTQFTPQNRLRQDNWQHDLFPARIAT